MPSGGNNNAGDSVESESHLCLIFLSVAVVLGTVDPGIQDSPHPHWDPSVGGGFWGAGGWNVPKWWASLLQDFKKELYRTSWLQCRFTMETHVAYVLD